MMLFSEIKSRNPEFEAICAEHTVGELYAFGSAVTEKFNPEKSDYDLLVYLTETDPDIKGEKLLSLWDNLEKFFNRRIDLLTESSLKNPYLVKSIHETRVKLYDGKSKKVPV